MRNALVMLTLAVLAGATWLATWEPREARVPAGTAAPAEPLGYYLRGARILGWDEQGRLTYRISAERLDELPGEDGVRLTGVGVDYQPVDDTAWSISAGTATSTKDVSLLELAGKVELRAAPKEGSEPLTIVTERLTFSPDTSRAESSEAVEVRIGDWEWRGVGLFADLKGETLKLESEVHGTLAP